MGAKRRSRKSSKSIKKAFDRPKVEKAIKLLLDGIGEDPTREGLLQTPRRVCDLWEEVLSGMWENPSAYLRPITGESNQDLVVIKNIRFVSICEHHLLPFIGKVTVGYSPRGRRIVGISKIVRTVNALAHRLQIQERLTTQIADVVEKTLKPAGLLVIVEAEHLCMTIRGVKKPGTMIVTKEARGTFRKPDMQALVLS